MYLRKTAFIITALVAAISVTGCAEKDNTESTDNSISSSAEEVSVSSDTDNSSDNDDSKPVSEEGQVLASNDSYTVYLENLGGEVFYPQISGMKDESIQAKLNDELKLLESERYELMKIQTERYVATSEVMYSDESTLSLHHTAEFYFEDANDPASSGTIINLNMETGEEIELTDIADTALLAEKIYNNDGVKIIDGYENAKLDDYLTERHIQSVEDIKQDIERGGFMLDENKNIIISLSTSAGIIRITVEI